MAFDKIEVTLAYEDEDTFVPNTPRWPQSRTNIIARGRIFAQQLDTETYLRAHHKLRYQVYCREQSFLPADSYPDCLEVDEYDSQSTHFGVFLDDVSPDRMIATSRLVPGVERFPLHDHCTISQQFARYFASEVRAAEISRFMICRAALAKFGGRDAYTLRRDILIALYKAMYDWVEAEGISLLFAAMEAPLARVLRKTGFPFLEIGPEVDYYGRVFPYVLDIAFGKHHLRTREPDIWKFFVEDQSQQRGLSNFEPWLSSNAKVA